MAKLPQSENAFFQMLLALHASRNIRPFRDYLELGDKDDLDEILEQNIPLDRRENVSLFFADLASLAKIAECPTLSERLRFLSRFIHNSIYGPSPF